jgi:phage-related protein
MDVTPDVPGSKDIVFLGDSRIRTPPFSLEARVVSGMMLRRLQDGELLGMPISRPMPGIGPRCHELRVRDGDASWRIVYRIDPREVLVVAVFAKKTRATPDEVIRLCRKRLSVYDNPPRGSEGPR